jgi:signal transduction histidine kinase
VVKYAPGVPVEISLNASEAGATVVVRDQGKGIPEDKFERIFERFARLEAPRAVNGLGLGLSIAKQIVEAHGGAISVSSAPGRGSEFRVTLPSVPARALAAKVG